MRHKTKVAKHFKGVNWADARDNFVDGWIIPSGINHELDSKYIQVEASYILLQLIRNYFLLQV